jgi:predicted Zn-dependent peptidase
MKLATYDRLQETLASDRLPNGLTVHVLPKPGFYKTFATFTTKYGSIDNHFRVAGREALKVPDGIAHFLEHKMFEEPDGDVFAKFAAQGASANAFTTFDRTTYLFSATDRIPDNLKTLLDFVQHPYFTEQSVEKEKGIIAQEIGMYRDNPDFRVYFGLIEALYQKHPVHIDIAGTVESIYQITREMLYDCYHTFYHPSNMSLVVVGNVDPGEIMQLVRDNQAGKPAAPQGEIERLFEAEPPEVRTPEQRIRLAVSMPKCLIGFKDESTPAGGRELLVQELETKLLLDVLFSPSSDIFQKLYDEQLITDQFASEYNTGPGYAFAVVGGETRDPDALVGRIREEVDRLLARGGIGEADFERSRRKKIGAFLRMWNSPEAIAYEFTRYHLRQMDLFDVLETYERMTPEQVNRRFAALFRWDRSAVSIVERAGA